MTIDWNFELVDQLEWHWVRQLRPRLDGLTDDEYFWEPVSGCWTLRRHEGEFVMDFDRPPPEPAPVTTIAWRMAHLIAVLGSPAGPHFDGPRVRYPSGGYPGGAGEALRLLDEGYEGWIRDVRALGTAGLARPQGALSPPEFAAAPMARLVLHVHREVIHHGAEVCLLRDLYGRDAAEAAGRD